MIDHASVATWLESYIHAWKTYDPELIGSLFSEQATYAYNPFDQPLHGRAAIIASWLENRDAPGTYDAHYKPIAVEGNVAVINGRSHYFEADGKTSKKSYDNIFVLRFDDQGHCIEFREWFMQPRGQ